MDIPIHMWKWWAERKGFDALPEYYPELFQTDEILKTALAQKQMVELAIKSRFETLAQKEQDDDPSLD